MVGVVDVLAFLVLFGRLPVLGVRMTGYVPVLLAQVHPLRLHEQVYLNVLLALGLVQILISVEVRFLLASSSNMRTAVAVLDAAR